MKTPLAWRNLSHETSRTAVGVGGVAFACVLVLMQLGFLGSVQKTATNVYSALDFDLLLSSPEYLHFAEAQSFPMARLRQAQSTPGVASANPLRVSGNRWRNPRSEPPHGGTTRAILVLGVDPHDHVFSRESISRELPRLTREDFVLVDRTSRAEFGPAEGLTFGEADIGQETEVGGRRIRIVGTFELGSGLAADGAMIINADGFVRITPGASLQQTSLGLIKLKVAEGEADSPQALEALREATAEALRQTLQGYSDVEVLTRTQALEREMKYWVQGTSVGVIFTFGAILGTIVGLAIVYQVLEADITRHLKEYATMKAMGFNYVNLLTIILKQSLVLAVLGYGVGMLMTAYLGYPVTSWLSGLPIEVDQRQAIGVFFGSIVVCALSGIAASRKLRSAEPADLF